MNGVICVGVPPDKSRLRVSNRGLWSGRSEWGGWGGFAVWVDLLAGVFSALAAAG